MRNFFSTMLLICLLAAQDVTAQLRQFWTPATTQSRQSQGVRYITPDHYATFHFDAKAFRTFITSGNLRSQMFEVPTPDGDFISFLMMETPVFDEGLSERYPGYTSFTGTNDSGDRLKLSISPFGINGMIFSDKFGHIFIDPITLHDHNEVYQVYHKKDFRKKTGKFTCSILSATDGHLSEYTPIINEKSTGARYVGDCQLRSYRLAISCTGEYAAFHGGTKEKVLAAYNTTMTRVNGVYERDAGITMKIIPDVDKIIYLNANTDPFTNGNGDAMLGQNQTTIDNVIGRSNYDIGHVFSTGGGGVAQIRSPCGNSKAMGVTGQNRPVGDPFDIDYVAHEMGHQFGANHTQNNSCQRSGQAAMEPGSASTIMGYAGICAPNVQNNSDAYFHAHSLLEISNFVVAGNGNSCATIIPVANAKPTVSVTKNDYTIPRSTAFELTAIGTDPDGDILTYCWEQMNNNVATMPPVATNTGGPTFRSLTPSISPTRYFPDLLRRYGQWEVLPSVTRNLNFRCTVRDNHPLLGCTDEVNVIVRVNAQAGPFVVIYPNTSSVTWLSGSTQTVTWDIAKTDVAPINCTSVDVYLSTDGGESYPTLLATNVPNNGAVDIVVPGVSTTRARVMVKAADNIFFDVSNANFKIVSSFDIKFIKPTIDICTQTSLSNTMEITRVENSTVPVVLSVVNPLSTLNYSFSTNPINTLPSFVDVSISGLGTLSKGWHNVEIKGSRDAESVSTSFAVFMGYTGTNTVNLLYPEQSQFDVPHNNADFTWQHIPGVRDYTFELSLLPSFTDISRTIVTELTTVNVLLEPGKVYFWRVKPNSPCVSLPYSTVFSLRTLGGSTGVATLLSNEGLLVNKSEVAIIDSTRLYALGSNKDFIIFTITNSTSEGLLYKETELLTTGSTFTMSDVVLGKIKYEHAGGAVTFDSFSFNVLDDLGRWLPGQVFTIKINQGVLGVFGYRNKNLNCFGDENGEIRAEGFGGVSPYQYAIDGTNFQSEPLFQNLRSGNYVLSVKDATGNIAQANEISLVEPQQIIVTLLHDKYDVLVNASGGTGLLINSIDGSNFQPEQVFRDPGNGLVQVTVQDELGCRQSSDIVIEIPLLIVTGQVTTDVKCATQNGVITLQGSGGFEPYTYSLDGVSFKASPNFSVQPGKYVFQIKDGGNKIVFSDTIATNIPAPIQLELIQNKLVITVNASGGTGPLMYSTNNVNFTDNNIITFGNNGTYRIYVRDSLLCSSSINITINVLKDLNITTRDVSCFGKSDGFIRIVPVNGVLPFRYSLNGSEFSNVREWSNLPGGEYQYTVKDSKNDSLTGTIQIVHPDSMSLEFLVSDNNLEIIVSGGTPPFVHSIDNGNLFLDTNQFTELDDDKYEVVVRDKNGCLAQGTVLISSSAETQLSGLRIFPNPTHDNLFVVSDSQVTVQSVHLTDISGRNTIVDVKVQNDMIQIGLDGLPPGIYVLRLVTNEGTLSHLVIKGK